MPGSQNTSFIPKQNAARVERKNTPRQLFIGTILVRVLFFAVLIASVGAFAYDRRVQGQLAAEVTAFKNATGSFEADEQRLQTVLSIDRRLVQANQRIRNSASVLTVLTALEAATVQSAQIESLTITREDETTILAEATVKTDSFDSVLFQRNILESNEVLKGVALQDVSIINDAEAEEGASVGTVEAISFRAEFAINQSSIPVVPRQTVPQTTAPAFVPAVVAPSSDPVPASEPTATNQNSL